MLIYQVFPMYLARRDVIVNFVRKSLLDGKDTKLESGELVSINKILKYLVMLYAIREFKVN